MLVLKLQWPTASMLEILFNWGPWDVVDTNWLTAEWCIPNKWYSATSIGSLRSHCVESCDDSDYATIQQTKSQNPNRDHTVEEDLVFRLPLNISIFVNLCGRTSGARRN